MKSVYIYIYTKNIVYTFIWLGVLFIWEPSHFMPLFLLNPPSPIYKIYWSFTVMWIMFNIGRPPTINSLSTHYQPSSCASNSTVTVIVFTGSPVFNGSPRFPVTLQIGLNGENVCHRHFTELGVPELFGDMKHRETRLYIYIGFNGLVLLGQD